MTRPAIGGVLIAVGAGCVLAGVLGLLRTGSFRDGATASGPTPSVAVAPLVVDGTASPSDQPTSSPLLPTASPAASSPAASSPAAASTVDVEERILEFVQEYAAAIAAEDVDLLVATLHPAVFEVVDAATCRRYVEEEVLGLQDLEVVGQPDGPSSRRFGAVLVDQFYLVDVEAEFRGRTFTITAAFAPSDDGIGWFSDCA